MNYLRLIGYKNLMMIIAMQIIIVYLLFVPFHIDVALNNLGIFLLILSSTCIMAAGQIISHLSNQKAIAVNQPKLAAALNSIPEKRSYNLFMGLNIIGIGIGFYLSNSVTVPGLSALFIVASILFYLNATYFTQFLLVRNLIMAILGALGIIILGLMDLLPAITPNNQTTQNTIFSILLDYALLAFLLVFLFQMIKDQINMAGDHKAKKVTLPISLGKKRTNKILFALGCIIVFSVVYYLYTYLFSHKIIVIYALVFIILPLLYFLAKIISAKTQKDYTHLAFTLRICIWFSIFSIGLYAFLLQ